jgi:hypothetical protein
MRNALLILAGFVAGAGLVAAVVVAAPHATSASAAPAVRPTAATAPTAGSQIAGGSMMSGSRTGGTASAGQGSPMMAATRSPAARKLTIQHVLRGCHVWSNGTMTGPTMQLHLQVGQSLSITDMDVDAHQLLELAGPSHLQIGGPMMTSGHMTVSFPMKGVYRLGTKTVPMPGGMDVKTIGPDNKLRLVVTVA